MTETGTNEDGLESRNRIVAFVDILGASQAAISGESSKLVRDIFQLGRAMQTRYKIHSTSPRGITETRGFKPNFVAFSDCLLLWSDPLDGLNAEQFVREASIFLRYLCSEIGSLLLNNVPFRAGVSEGPVYIYPEHNIYAGRPIVEAAKLESCQDWLGAAMLFADLPDRLIKKPDQIYVAGDRSIFKHFVVPDAPVPLKKGTPEYLSKHTVIALNWALSVQEQQGPTYESLKTRLQTLQIKAGTGNGIQEKYEHAIQFLSKVEHGVAKNKCEKDDPMKLIGIPNVCPVPDELDLPCMVYKYRTVNEFLLSSLSLNQVWLAKPDTFNDPFEPERIFSGSTFSHALARDVREAGVLCLCKRNDNLAMWSYYGNALKGIAIGYDLANLVRSLEPVALTQNECSPRWRYVYDLAYLDDGLSLTQEMSLLYTQEERAREYQKMFATKAAAFDHEDECRIVVPPSPDQPDTWPEHAWSGHGLYQHSLDAVKEIVFGELVTEQDRQAITQIMVGRDVAFYDAVRDKTRFKIQIQPVVS